MAICRCSSFFAKGHIRIGYSVASALINAFGSLPTFCESAYGANISMVRYCQIGHKPHSCAVCVFSIHIFYTFFEGKLMRTYTESEMIDTSEDVFIQKKFYTEKYC